MEKKKVVISIIFVALIIVVAIHARYMEKEIETYNSQASASKEAFEDFCTCALDVFDETQTTFSDLQRSYTGVMANMKVWARNHYAHWQEKDLPYEITYEEEEGDPLMDTYFAIPQLYSDLVNAYYLKEPEYEITLTKEQVEKRVAELRSEMEIHCVPFS